MNLNHFYSTGELQQNGERFRIAAGDIGDDTQTIQVPRQQIGRNVRLIFDDSGPSLAELVPELNRRSNERYRT